MCRFHKTYFEINYDKQIRYRSPNLTRISIISVQCDGSLTVSSNSPVNVGDDLVILCTLSSSYNLGEITISKNETTTRDYFYNSTGLFTSHTRATAQYNGAGASVFTLTVSAAELTDAGVYVVHVTDDVGNSTTGNTTVDISRKYFFLHFTGRMLIRAWIEFDPRY